LNIEWDSLQDAHRNQKINWNHGSKGIGVFQQQLTAFVPFQMQSCLS